MYTGVTYVPCIWLSMGPLLSPCFCNLNVSLSLTPRVLLEYVSCRASAHLPWHLFYASFLLWPCCSGSLPHYLMPGPSWCVFPGFPITPTLAMTSRLTWPRAYLFPHSPFRAFQGSLPWRGSAGRWGLRCPLPAALPLQLSLAPSWPWGATCRFLGRACSCLLPPCHQNTFPSLSTWRIFFKINLQHYFSSSSPRVNVTTFLLMPTCYFVVL